MRRMMALALGSLLLIAGAPVPAAPATGRLAAVGVPVVVTAHNGKLVATARISKAPAGPDTVMQTQWPFSEFQAPRSQVGRIRITVSGRDVIVPLSAVMGLYEPGEVALKADRSGFVLQIHGGDAYLAYDARIRFDGTDVLERTITGGESGQLQERTTYNTAPFPYE